MRNNHFSNHFVHRIITFFGVFGVIFGLLLAPVVVRAEAPSSRLSSDESELDEATSNDDSSGSGDKLLMAVSRVICNDGTIFYDGQFGSCVGLYAAASAACRGHGGISYYRCYSL